LKLPRDISGPEAVKALERLGFSTTGKVAPMFK
jgi:hypothetical protein